jgi:hypothetical protein
VPCSVDEFIDNAHNYAHGLDNVISIRTGKVEHVFASGPKQPYRKATFTLSEDCIGSLNELATLTGHSKSHLVRMMIRQFDQTSPVEQRLLLERQKD